MSQSTEKPATEKFAAEDLVAQILAPLGAIDVPATLAHSIVQHQQNLIGLATALLANGCDKATVEASLATMFDSYRAQLTNVILRLKEDANDART
jgi:hypothetical protein